MKVNLHIADFTSAPETSGIAAMLAEAAGTADEAGFATISLMDHYFQIDGLGAIDDPMLEGYVTLGFLAAHTERCHLGLLVSGVTYRHPGLLAKIISSLDVLSNGRAQLGIGAAWYEEEHAGLGVPFPPLRERFEQLEETVKICRQVWSDEREPFVGRHYHLKQTLGSPANIAQPHVPILIGGSGEQKTLKLVATYADACNLFVDTPAEAEHKLNVLRRHCHDAQTDFDRIEKTFVYAGSTLDSDDFDSFAAEMRQFEQIGMDAVVVMPTQRHLISYVERLAPTVAKLAT